VGRGRRPARLGSDETDYGRTAPGLTDEDCGARVVLVCVGLDVL